MVLPERINGGVFYQTLLLLETLDPIRGEKAASGTTDGDTRLDHSSVRRAFVDAIAYICAYSWRADNVAAAALQQNPIGITVWLAGNDAIEPKVLAFLRSILSDLTEIARLDCDIAITRAELLRTQTLLPNIIAFETPKLHKYYKLIMDKYISPCLELIRTALSQGNSGPFMPFQLS
jgi:hypothetical protein